MKTTAHFDTSDQLELAPPPAVTDVCWLENLLRAAGGWMTAGNILRTCAGAGLHDRAIRELASASRNIISGQKGYKHVEHATVEEIAHFRNWMVSQGKEMIRRGLRVGRAAHGRMG